ncbi:MAG: hypothetical protein HXY38_01420 [Chloroflexi bacterium]|nr:hypothetical protein [Chloroflexota bacterium]
MKQSPTRMIIALSFLIIAALACGTPAAETPTEASPDAEAPTEIVEAPPAQPEIQHSTIPVSLPADQNGVAGDFDSSKVLNSGSLVGGDRFTFGRFERPFNANSMDTYYAELDIVNTEVFQDDLWIYGRISIKELSATSSTAQYAVELDTNLNGKADWLVVADKPTSTEWSVTGVRVYQDANQDVGGEMPALTDDVKPNGDGFETLFFDQGSGENSDTAWVRISPTDANIVEFAMNRAALSNPNQYLINFWAGRNIDPAIFDINDAFTHEEAGAADAGLEYFYPIKAVSEIDNSCRMAVGFQPNGSEPGICPVPVKEAQGVPPVPPGTSCSAGTILVCLTNNCFCMPLVFTNPTVPPQVP